MCMGVSRNGGTQQLDGLCSGKSHPEMDDWGVPPFQETTIFFLSLYMAMLGSPLYPAGHQLVDVQPPKTDDVMVVII